MKDTELAYIAGIVDGEGYIGAEQINPGKSGGYQRRMRWHIRVGVGITDKEVVDYLKDKLGGSVHVRNRQSDRWKTCYYWRVTAGNAKQVLLSLMPYLKIKKERAKLAIKIQNLRELPREKRYFWEKHFNPHFNTPGLGGYKVRQEIVAKEAFLAQEIKDLNRKGAPSAI